MPPFSNPIVHFDTGMSWRGGQSQVMLLVSGLADRGYRQLVICPQESPLHYKVRSAGIDTAHVEAGNDLDIPAGIGFRKIIRRVNPCIIHFHTSRALGIGSWAARGWSGKTLYTRRLDLRIGRNPLNMFKYRYPGRIVVISDFIKRYFTELGFKNVETVYSSVDLSRFSPVLQKKPGEVFRVGMAGAMDLRQKDFITFVKAAVEAYRRVPQSKRIEFHIAGEGKDRQTIVKLIEDLNAASYIKLDGFINDIEDFYHTMDLMLHTVNFEGLGTAVLQAMACGVPAVATAAGGLTEIVRDGVSGFLVPVKDHVRAAERIIKLMYDPGLLESFSRRGVEIIRNRFSNSIMVDRYEEIYEKLAGS